MMVYLITSGSGDDGSEWSLHAIFSTRQSAEQYKERHNTIIRDDGTTYEWGLCIEEWSVNTM